MALIPVTRTLAIDDAELEESFIQSSGPGGQNVNKVATAVQLRFDAARSPSLTPPLRARLRTLAGRRMTLDGVLVIVARAHRTQDRNRADALARLLDLLRQAAAPPPPQRRATRPTLASKQRRLAGKRVRSGVKQGRAKPDAE